jgi:hypothetical protein
MSAITDRQALRETLASLAEKTKSKLPALNGRIEKACRLVLHGDVELHPDGTAMVNSLSDATRAYQLAQGVCQCRDWGQAPEHLCAHRLAVGFLRKANSLLQVAEDVQAPRKPQAPTSPPSETPSMALVHDAPTALPEARASLNFKALIGGYETQITLRSDTEEELLQRLQALIKRSDLKPVPKPAPKGNWKRTYQGR